MTKDKHPLSKSLPAVLNARDVADLLMVSTSIVYRAIRREEFPGVERIGSKLYRFDRDVILKWLTEKER